MRGFIKSYFISLLIILFSMLTAFAGDAGQESQFSIGSGVRAVGMGGGFVAMADDASTIYWNQAGLARLEYQEFNVMHATLFEGSIYDVASYVYRHRALGGFGISFMRLGTENITRRIDWVEDGSFGYSMSQLMFGYGRSIWGDLALGGALKVYNQSLDNNGTYGVGADLSALMTISDKVSFGAIMQDIISPRLRLSDRTETIPHTLMLGMAMHNPLDFNIFQTNINVALEIPEKRAARIHFGAESYYDWFDFRAGYDRDNFTFGVGFTRGRLRVDYAYRIMEGITDSHRFGLSYKIGKSMKEQMRLENELRDAEGNYLILDDRKRQMEHYKSKADGFYRADNVDSALSYYQRALAYRPDDPELLGKISMLTQMRDQKILAEGSELNSEASRRAILDNYYNRADRFLTDGNLNEARTWIDMALKLEPDQARFHALNSRLNDEVAARTANLLSQASTAENDGRLFDAIMDYTQILNLSPNNVIAEQMRKRAASSIDGIQITGLGLEAYYKNDFETARQKFTEALEVDKNNRVAREYLNRITTPSPVPETEKREDLRQDVETWKIYLNALRHYQDGEYEEAIKLWKQILEKYPGNEETLENIRQAELRMRPENKQ
jgi:tetratricopeptide (TPR) repeat protein